LEEVVGDLDKKKTDESKFNKLYGHMNKTIEITHKRLNHDEGEMKEFGNFVLQYMPMNLQNIITENLLLSNPNATGLKNL